MGNKSIETYAEVLRRQGWREGWWEGLLVGAVVGMAGLAVLVRLLLIFGH